MWINVDYKLQRVFYSSIIILFILITRSFVYANTEVDEINQAIKAKGARWVAGETSMTKLSGEERRKRLGALIPDVGEATHKMFTGNPAAAAPPALDWRNNNGGNYVTPIKNQNPCGACWAFASTAALESQVLITTNAPGADIDLSEQILISCNDFGGCTVGAPLDFAANYILNIGLPVESCFPYTGTDTSCANACANWENNTTYGISGWLYVAAADSSYPFLTVDVDAIKSALYTYGPLVTVMIVYSDFYSYKSGIYSYTTGTYVAGHNILIIGYDDSGQYFICKNSWGPGWGESGFFRIAYSEFTSVVNFGVSTIAYTGYSSITVPHQFVFVTEWGSKGVGNGQFDFPQGIAVDSWGNVYVADTGHYRIQMLTADGTFVTAWGSSGTEIEQLNSAGGIAVDSQENLYVAKTNNNSISVFAPTIPPTTSSSSTTTIPPTTSSSSTTTIYPCPLSTVMSEGSQDLDKLRAFRNELLLKTEEGKQYTVLYYKHAIKLSNIFAHSEALKEKATVLIQSIMPAVGSLLEKGEAAIDEDTVQKSIVLIDALRAQASPALEQDLTHLKQDIQNGVIFKTFGVKIQKD